MAYKLYLPLEIVELLRGLSPTPKRKIRSALDEILMDPRQGKELQDELSGLRSYRVGQYRIIYRVDSKHRVDILGVGPRESIYIDMYRKTKE